MTFYEYISQTPLFDFVTDPNSVFILCFVWCYVFLVKSFDRLKKTRENLRLINQTILKVESD